MDKEALTYDDILLVPQYSEILPSEIKTRSFFARDLYLNMPLISAAMDTVTENKMARVLAQLGGLGIIHKNLSIESQAFEVEKVKKYESGMITDPITLPPEATVAEALELMAKYSISGVPITVGGKLVGILTNRDLRFETHTEQPVSNIMTKENLVVTQLGTTLEEAKTTLQKHRIEKLPVVDPQGMLSGLITIKDIEKSQNIPLINIETMLQALFEGNLKTERPKPPPIIIQKENTKESNGISKLEWERLEQKHQEIRERFAYVLKQVELVKNRFGNTGVPTRRSDFA